jgi:signal transduction histidine kinase
MSPEQDTSFVRLVSLACHDLRTPLATVHGFARTIARTGELEEPASRYLEMIEAASGQLAELLDELSLAARIEERVDVGVEGREVCVSPITPASAPVVLGEDLRDLGAAVAVRLVRALGGSVELDGGVLRVRLPA